MFLSHISWPWGFFSFFMSSVAQLEAEILTGRGLFKKKYTQPLFKRESMIDRALESVSTPYKLAIFSKWPRLIYLNITKKLE